MRKILVFEDYFKDFRKTLDRDTLKKVYQVLTLIMRVEVIPSKYLKPIEGRGNNEELFQSEKEARQWIRATSAR